MYTYTIMHIYIYDITLQFIILLYMSKSCFSIEALQCIAMETLLHQGLQLVEITGIGRKVGAPPGPQGEVP